MIGDTTLASWFSYHTPSEEEVITYKALRDAAYRFATVIVTLTPPSADQSAAIRLVREAVMTANAAIACKGK